MKNNMNRSKKRSGNRKRKSLKGGYIRDGVPQFSEYCGTNPNFLEQGIIGCQKCSGGGSRKRSRRNSKKNRQMRGGAIRDNVPQFSEYCGKNPLWQ